MDTITRTEYYSMAEIIYANRRLGQHFFSDGAKRFFNSRIGQSVYGGRYFITSEQFDRDRSPRLYTIRECINGNIETVGEFQQYETHAQARSAIKKLLA
jgi:hypothetical protein